jgi:hypothetical protein
MLKTTNTDKLAFYTSEPDVKELTAELSRSLYGASNHERVNTADDIRFCKWAGQSDDGKKHSEKLSGNKQAFPFEGASDVRTRLADNTINELANLLTTSSERSNLSISSTEFNDLQTAGVASTLMTWITKQKIRSEIQRESELGAQYGLHYGWTVFYVGWDQQLSVRYQRVSMEEIAGIAQQAEGSAIADLPNLIANKATRDQAVQLLLTVMPDMELSDAKELVDDLRETGEGKVEEQYVRKNLPCVMALKPFDEIAFPPETLDLQNARVIFRRIYMTEVEVRSKEQTEGWSKEFIDSVVSTSGQQNWFSATTNTIASLTSSPVQRQDNLIEIVYAYARQISDEGVPAIYCTVISPLLKDDLYAKHELLDYAHGDYPFIEFKREVTRRTVTESRGIPELTMTDQDEIKAQHDSIRDRTAFETLPPMRVVKRIGQINKIGPGVQLPVTRPDDYTWMDPPARAPQTAFSLIERVEAQHASYFGLNHPAVNQIKAQLMQQQLVNRWLCTWSRIYSQMFSLCLQYMPPEEIERVTGASLSQNMTDIAGSFDFVVSFSIQSLDNELVAKKLKSISEYVVPLDSGGVLDRNKLVRMILDGIVPESSKDLIMSDSAASEVMFKGVQSDIGLMMLGHEPLYTENDPAAQTKMQYVQDILSKNPKAQQSAQGDPIFQTLLENYTKNLQMSIMQQQNAQIGRTGVTPVGDSMMQEQAQGEQPTEGMM